MDGYGALKGGVGFCKSMKEVKPEKKTLRLGSDRILN